MRFSIVCGEYHRILKEHSAVVTDVSAEIDIRKILPSIIESTHPYFMISTLIMVIVYVLFSICSPMSATRLMCLALGLYILVNYILHATFFSSCLVITLKRVSSRRHCLFCFRLSENYYTKTSRELNHLASLKRIIHSPLNINSKLKEVFSVCLCLLLVVSIIPNIWYLLSIDTCLFSDQLLPRDEYALRSHMKSQAEDFDVGPVIMFTIPEAINYENEQNKLAINSLLDQCVNVKQTNTFKLLWLDHEDIDKIKVPNSRLESRITPYSRNDLIIFDRENYSTIEASRFYCQYKSVKGKRVIYNCFLWQISNILKQRSSLIFYNENYKLKIFKHKIVNTNLEPDSPICQLSVPFDSVFEICCSSSTFFKFLKSF